MKKTALVRCAFVFSGLLPLLVASPALADMLFIFSPGPGGGVNVVGSGSGFTDRDPDISTSDWDIQDFMTDFLKDTYTATQTSATTVNGTFTNVTTNITETLLNFDVDRDPDSGDDLDFDTSNALTFNLGDEYLFSMTAFFDASALPYSELILGTHIDVGHTQGAGIADESFGISTVRVVVPEPASAGLLFACIASICVTACRCKR